MPTVTFTDNLRKHVDIDTVQVPGGTVRETLANVFLEYPTLRSYVLDDQGLVRRHVKIFVANEAVASHVVLERPLADADHVFVMQSLSGG